MARRKGPTKDPHQRFTEWLEEVSAEDPPRDLAVHAAVCVDCQDLIAAVDALTSIDTALAGIPQVRPLPAGGWLRTHGRAAVAVGGLAALVLVGVASWRLIQTSGVVFVLPVESPTQEVLGNTGTPRPTPSPTTLASGQPASGDPTPPGQAPTSPAPFTIPPFVFPPPPTFGPPAPPSPVPPGPTARPTVRPSIRPTGTPRPTQTAAPTPAPTPTPPPPPTPTPEPTPGGGPLPECIDTVDNDGDGFIDLLDVDCLNVFDLSESS